MHIAVKAVIALIVLFIVAVSAWLLSGSVPRRPMAPAAVVRQQRVGNRDPRNGLDLCIGTPGSC